MNKECKKQEQRKENKSLEFAKEIANNENRRKEEQKRQKDC